MAVTHDLPLISTLATGLSLAFLFGLTAAKLRIPPIVGYLLAGIVIGPYTPGFVGNIKIAEELSEIGIVLLMFGVGLHFSTKDLMEVKKIALPGAIVQMGAAILMGAGLAYYVWDWPLHSGLMFGLALSVASTVVLLRALEEHNLLQSMNGRIAIGWLIVEDLAMVLALVLVPALAATVAPAEGAAAAETSLALSLLAALGKVALFIAVMFFGGKRLLPWLLGVVAQTRSRELFTLAVFVAALGVAFAASKLFDISLALGAFFAGMMIRESDLNHEAADRALPFQDAFAVVFFVAVGMLFDPKVLITQPLNVVLTSLIIMVGKSLAAFLIVILFKYPMKTGLLVSASLAQIGEFSFILVGLGVVYNLLPESGRDLVLAGALVSIALNPLAFRFSRAIYEYSGRSARLSSIFNISPEADLSQLTRNEKVTLKDTVILVGYGKVGVHISQNVQEAHIDLVIIDSNREKVDTLRERGLHAIAGDATHPETLQEAAISKAVALAVAIPDPFAARRIVEEAKILNPNLRILVRAHNDEEMDYFYEQNADLALTGPREIGRRMVEYLNDMRKTKPAAKPHS
ncbi:MAG TPA: YbaL family putative K(+) efflux transporter [Alphaproteobacteria bacterium]|nr:Kef family K(+) transporter [Rhodospirillaceae bacterium]HRJ65954.1 YbaL family putative K(+) efflux transporter [Alphaproteobacteria bacterium]